MIADNQWPIISDMHTGMGTGPNITVYTKGKIINRDTVIGLENLNVTLIDFVSPRPFH